MTILFPILVGSAVILLLEWIMWRLFLRRVAGIDFPRDVDKSHLRFFTVGRIRLCAIVHTCFLLLVVLLTSMLAW